MPFNFDPTTYNIDFWIKFSLYAGIAIVVIYVFFIVAANLLNKSYANQKRPDVPIKDVPANLKGRVEQIMFNAQDDRQRIEAIAEMIDEEAVNKSAELRKEFGEKYQSLVMEKNAEIDSVKKVYKEVKQQFEVVEKNYKKVDSEKKQTEAVVRSIAEGLVVVNQKGEVLLMNPSAEKLLGVQGSKKLGKPLVEDVPDELMISMSKEVGDSGEKIIEYQSRDENVKKILRSSSAVIQNEDGQTVGMVNILTDVTKQRELDDMKNRFVSNVTHELRTPIVTMQNAVAILLSEAATLTEPQKKFLNIVSRSSEQLKRLVEDVLDIAKIDSGKMEIKPKLAKLEKVIQEACDALDAWAKSKELQIVREIDKNVPVEMFFDAGKITQVLNNLISNAIKFTPQKGTITVKVKKNTDLNKVEVSITDTGLGIAPENLSRLFKRFEQFGDSQGISGTGLGLAIVKDLVEKHSGEVSVKSEINKGTVFTFTLPIKDKVA